MDDQKRKRIYYLDAMRGILILSIVLIHSLQVYNPQQSWIIYSEKGMVAVPYLIEMLMLFTLPSFFMMSGYLAAMSISRAGAERFFESRLKRIAVPIVVAAVTLNSLQAFVLVQSGWMRFDLSEYLAKGLWVSHLWFLIDLAVFFVVLYIAVRFFRPILLRIDQGIGTFIRKISIYPLLFLVSFLTVVLLALYSVASEYLYNPLLDVRSLAFYFPFFFFGILLFRYPELLRKLESINIFAVLILTGIMLALSHYFSGYESKWYKLVYYFFDTASYLFASTLCFVFFHRFFNRRLHILKLLADASYTVYLFHHLLVVTLGLLLIESEISAVVALPLLFLSAAGISLMIHYFLVEKIPLLGFLFNGKKRSV